MEDIGINLDTLDLDSLDKADAPNDEITLDTPVSPEEIAALDKEYREKYGMSYSEFQEKYPPLTMDELMSVLGK